MNFKLDKTLIEFSKIFFKAGYSCYLVGGAVRNLYAGLPVSDYDFTTNAHPETIIKLFKRVIPTGIKHGTVTVLFRDLKLEVTTYRTDGDYSDNRRPDKVEFTSSILDDLKRRDFTINSMAYDPLTKELLDPHNGKSDLKNKKIRAIGNPAERFQEDALRIMRACRFVAQLGFFIEPETLSGMKEKSSNLKSVSAERIRDEILKILSSKKPSSAFHVMEETAVLKLILPELSDCRGIEQKGYHNFDVLDHCLYSCDGAPQDNLTVRTAAALHDIGKPIALGHDELGIPTFHGHELASERLSKNILERLKVPKAFETDVLHLIKHHMFNYLPEWSDSAVRRFIAKVGYNNLNNLFLLRVADQYGMNNKPVNSINLYDFKKRIEEILTKDHAFSIKDLDINGNILINDASIPKGPEVGIVLDYLLETVLDDPSQNVEKKLIEIASNFYQTRLS
ncbi:MAG: CCA tRNA nucleotidyltransferase [Spirochaetales bacterium]|nr:CCA tRNA nucleotidyltransferase [Spirochaetales bacterium]